jgi:hypothetical protein
MGWPNLLKPKVYNHFRRNVVFFLFLSIIFSFIVACGSKKESSTASKAKSPEIKIVMAPAEGDTIADLDQPLVMFFPEPVQAADFSFSIEPDPGGWKPVWDPSRKKLRLDHTNPFTPLKKHLVKVSVKGGPALKSVFKTGAADPSALLESDLTKGTITIDQAAQYWVMRIFKPGAVPEKYRYTRAPRSGTWDLLQVANQLEKLKQETVKELEPYLVKPNNPKSIYYQRLFGSVPRSAQASFSIVSDAYAAEPYVKEVYRTDTGYTIEIYGEQSVTDTVRKARRLVEEYKMYEKFEKLFNRKTLDYGDKTLRIHIFSKLRLEDDPEGGKSEPMGICYRVDWDPLSGLHPGTAVTWIAISASLNSADPDLASTLAHEIFHSFQLVFSRYEHRWLTEGTATWAEDFIGPDWNTEQRRLAELTFNAGENIHNHLTERITDKAYGMYLFFYYLTRVRSGASSDVMRRIWENCGANRLQSLESVKKALDADFKDVLKEYALYTLDVEPYKGKFPDTLGPYGGQNPLKLLDIHKLQEKWKINEMGSIDAQAFCLDFMSIIYLQVKNEAKGLNAPAVRFDLKEFLDKKEIGIQAVIKYRNGRVGKEDWTGLEQRVFCLSNKNQNFETIHLAVDWAKEAVKKGEWGDVFLLDLQPASDVDCVGGQMRISLTVSGQKESEYSKQWPGDNRSINKNSSWERQVRFLLQLTPQRNEMTAEVEAVIKNVPEEAKEKFLAEFYKPKMRFNQNTQCHEYIFRVKDVSVQSLSGTFKESTKSIQNDAFGLVKQCGEEREETWTSQGLSDETRESLKKKTLGVQVFIDPKSKQIKWVKPLGPVSAKGNITKGLKIECTQRKGQPPDIRYEPYIHSKQETQNAVWKVQEVSESFEGLPMSPDWQAKEVRETGARGEGKIERPLDQSSKEGQERTGRALYEKASTKSLEIKKIEWELQLDILPTPP